MKNLITTIFCLALTYCGVTQNLIKNYRKNADHSLLEYLDSGVASKVTCDRFTVISIDKQSSAGYLYNENKNKKLEFSSISFGYSLYDKILNENIYFYISIDKNHKEIRDSSIIKRVPLCIRTSQPCSFISSDSARIISISDSIEYPGNLGCQFELNSLDNEYYWIVTGRSSDKSKKDKPSSHVHVESISNFQERIINAKTGKIISYEKFSYDW